MNEPSPEVELSVSQFVALHNQVLEYTMPEVVIVGELSSFRISKNKWVYFDLKDDEATVKFFGTVFQLPGPLEDGMLLRVRGRPRVHPQFGFSVTIENITPAGEGTIKRAADLLQRKLQAEGLFDLARKRPLPYPPTRIGIVASKESAAYADFMKIINVRWSGLDISLINVQVQGEIAPGQIADAVAQFNQLPEPPEVLILTRGGGSAEDLWAFNTELVTRAVAGSRIPTLVAIGHEVDVSLAELAADVRASTPSNAAELLVPDKRAVKQSLTANRQHLQQSLQQVFKHAKTLLEQARRQLHQTLEHSIRRSRASLELKQQVLQLLNPQVILQKGYVMVRDADGRVVRTKKTAQKLSSFQLHFADGILRVKPEGK
ncbi:exodeoxyribonuclease VII large subunit [Candidatus Saccharibacteria bacterium]|nr:exodeoxyribonuclease VII large subunit [Candidatus Saccharibacteria bacterium]